MSAPMMSSVAFAIASSSPAHRRGDGRATAPGYAAKGTRFFQARFAGMPHSSRAGMITSEMVE